MSRRGRHGLAAAAAVLVGALLPACAVFGVDPTPVPTPTPAASTSSGSAATPSSCDNALESYAPGGSSGAAVAKIKARGRLIAGVSADTLLLGARNPFSGRIEGFDIDMVKAAAKAVLGDENAYQLKVITAAQRIPELQAGTVDIVVRAMSITCDRWKQIAFSTEYYRAGQTILVRRGSKASTLADLSGQRVCAPTGTSSMDKLVSGNPQAVPVGADTTTGCLVLFQQGKVDAITGDDTILAGLAAQDPYGVVSTQPTFTVESYGIGVNAKNVDLVRVINAQLEQIRRDGTWEKSYRTWLATPLRKASATPPAAVYGRTL